MRQHAKIFNVIISLLLVMTTGVGFAQKPYRVGTTTASFLEIGYGSAGSSMGDAYVSMAKDLSALYWNPAGLAFMGQNEAQFLRQPWIAGITSSFVGVGMVLPDVGTLSAGLFLMDYGDGEVTTVLQQEGTGEKFTASDFALALSYSRRLTHWFAFGASGKYISSKIWHSSASAMAVDLGVLINTDFFSMTGERENGMSIGMSISNYGTKMKYNGLDLVNPIDILPNEQGNFKDTPGQYRLNDWELPLIFRLGVSLQPIVAERMRLIVAADALHPNNNSESVNVGAQYQYKAPGTGTFYLRGGYKALFMNESEYGLTFGGGVELRMMHNFAVKVDYAYRGVGILGQAHSYSFSILF